MFGKQKLIKLVQNHPMYDDLCKQKGTTLKAEAAYMTAIEWAIALLIIALIVFVAGIFQTGLGTSGAGNFIGTLITGLNTVATTYWVLLLEAGVGILILLAVVYVARYLRERGLV